MLLAPQRLFNELSVRIPNPDINSKWFLARNLISSIQEITQKYGDYQYFGENCSKNLSQLSFFHRHLSCFIAANGQELKYAQLLSVKPVLL